MSFKEVQRMIHGHRFIIDGFYLRIDFEILSKKVILFQLLFFINLALVNHTRNVSLIGLNSRSDNILIKSIHSILVNRTLYSYDQFRIDCF